MTRQIDYTVAGPFTTISPRHQPALAELPTDPLAICRLVPRLVLHPMVAEPLGLPGKRLAKKQVRPTDDILDLLLAMDPAPLTVAREREQRVVGTCRHFAVLACALLRYRHIPARARCGFGMYFQPGRGSDHWIIEYQADDRWVRVDVEHLEDSFSAHPEDLREGEFLTGGEAWTAIREGSFQGEQFGVMGTENWGRHEASGNALRDLAALNRIEMLPWDEWGRMSEAYEGRTGPDYDELIDRVARVCASDDSQAVTALHEELPAPLG